MKNVDLMIKSSRFRALKKYLDSDEGKKIRDRKLRNLLYDLNGLYNGFGYVGEKLEYKDNSYEFLTECILKKDYNMAEAVIYGIIDDLPYDNLLYYYLEIIAEIKEVSRQFNKRKSIGIIYRAIGEKIDNVKDINHEFIDDLYTDMMKVFELEQKIGENTFNSQTQLEILNMMNQIIDEQIVKEDFGFIELSGDTEHDFYSALYYGDYVTAYQIIKGINIKRFFLDDNQRDIIQISRLLNLLNKLLKKNKVNKDCLTDKFMELFNNGCYDEAYQEYINQDSSSINPDIVANLLLLKDNVKVMKR